MEAPITFAEILSALSHALDITEGQPRGHAVRTTLITMRLAEILQLSESERHDLYYAALLKDAGCSSNAVRVYKVFAGDDLLTKRHVDEVFAIMRREAGAALNPECVEALCACTAAPLAA